MSSVPTSPLPPPRVPDHELIRRIGRGAYGEVWIARTVTGAYRAVKIVHRQSFDHDRPFEREFEGIQKFEPVSRTHDSQVDILHVGRGEDYFYYVMELADDQATGGQINPDNYRPRTLKSDLLFHSRLSFEECVSIGIALTTALEHLHENGLVHRDVKPSNIIFVNGVAKLADIGLVTGVDTTRSYVGTEGFAAPEGPGTTQGDLFSLGKVLYEMSTGKDRQEFPELPTNLRELPEREGLLELNAVIAKACRHDPRDRYPNAAAMRADLELLQSGKSLARLHRMEKQLRTLRRTGLAVTLVGVLTLSGWLYQARQTRIVRELANTNARLAGEKDKLADENRERLVHLNVANGVRVLDTDPTQAVLWFAEALPFVTNSAAESAIHRLRLQRLFDDLPCPIQVTAHDQSLLAGAFSEDGQLFATGTASGRLNVWDAETGTSKWESETNLPVGQMRFTLDGQRLLVSTAPPPNYGRFGHPSINRAVVIDLASNRWIFSERTTNVLAGTFSPDDHWLALANSNHAIRLIDIRDGRDILQLPGHRRAITSFSFNADGSMLASSSDDGTVRLWRLPSGEAAGELRHDGKVIRAVLSADGRRLAAVSAPSSGITNSTVHLWDLETGAQIGAPIPLAISDVCVLAFTDPAGRRLMLGGDIERKDRRLYFLDVHTREEILPAAEIRTPRCWAFSPDGKAVAVGEDGGLVSIFNPGTGELLYPPVRHSGWVESLEFSRDGTRILATSDAGTAIVWKLKQPAASKEKRFEAAISTRDRGSYARLLSPDQRRLTLPLRDRTIRVVDLDRMAEIHALKQTVTTNGPFVAHGRDGRHWAVVPQNDGRAWGSKTTPAAVDLWCEEDGAIRHFVLPHPSRFGDAAFNPAGTHLLTHCEDQRIRIWKTSDGTLERTVSVPEGTMLYMRFFPDGRTALIERPDHQDLHLFDLVTEKFFGQPIRTGSRTVAFDFDLESGRFAMGTGDNCGRIWSARTGEPLTPPFRQSGELHAVVWSPDRRRIITAGLGPSKVWDATTGKRNLGTVSEDSPRISTWSLDGRFIISLDRSRAVRLYDARTGEAVTPLIWTEGYVRLAVLLGNRLLTLSDPNLLQSWDLAETPLPVDIISDYARLLSGSRLNANGVLIALKPSELAELLQSVRARAPQLFQ